MEHGRLKHARSLPKRTSGTGCQALRAPRTTKLHGKLTGWNYSQGSADSATLTGKSWARGSWVNSNPWFIEVFTFSYFQLQKKALSEDRVSQDTMVYHHSSHQSYFFWYPPFSDTHHDCNPQQPAWWPVWSVFFTMASAKPRVISQLTFPSHHADFQLATHQYPPMAILAPLGRPNDQAPRSKWTRSPLDWFRLDIRQNDQKAKRFRCCDYDSWKAKRILESFPRRSHRIWPCWYCFSVGITLKEKAAQLPHDDWDTIVPLPGYCQYRHMAIYIYDYNIYMINICIIYICLYIYGYVYINMIYIYVYIYRTPLIFCNHISVPYSIISFRVLCDGCHLSVLQSWPRPLQVAIDHGKLWTFYKANSDKICSFLFKCGIPKTYPIQY